MFEAPSGDGDAEYDASAKWREPDKPCVAASIWLSAATAPPALAAPTPAPTPVAEPLALLDEADGKRPSEARADMPGGAALVGVGPGESEDTDKGEARAWARFAVLLSRRKAGVSAGCWGSGEVGSGCACSGDGGEDPPEDASMSAVVWSRGGSCRCSGRSARLPRALPPLPAWPSWAVSRNCPSRRSICL